MLNASEQGTPGLPGCLWKKESEVIRSVPNTEKYMQEWRFKQGKKFILFMFEDILLEDVDPWWHFVSVCHKFNNNRQITVAASVHKTCDKFMSAYQLRTTKTGGLPYLSYIK
eukprot:5126046-Ditylum_brightwellii.AAC.1